MLSVGRVQQQPVRLEVLVRWWLTGGDELCTVAMYLPAYGAQLGGELTFPVEYRVVDGRRVSHPELQVVAAVQAVLTGAGGRVSSGGIEIAEMQELSRMEGGVAGGRYYGEAGDPAHCAQLYRVSLWGPHWSVAVEVCDGRACLMGF